MYNKPLIHSSPIVENPYPNFSVSDFATEQSTSDQSKLNSVGTIVQKNLSAPLLSGETLSHSGLQQECHSTPKRQKAQIRWNHLPLKKRYLAKARLKQERSQTLPVQQEDKEDLPLTNTSLKSKKARRFSDLSTSTASSRKRAKLKHDDGNEISPSSRDKKPDECNSSINFDLNNSILEKMAISTLPSENSILPEPAPYDAFADSCIQQLTKKKSRSRRSIIPLRESQEILQQISSLEKIEKSLPCEKQPVNDNCYFTAATQEYLLFTQENNMLERRSFIVLTGKLVPHLIPEEASDELRTNLAIAKSIISYVQNAVPFSSNYFERSKLFSSNYYDPNCLTPLKDVIDRSLKLVRKKIKNSADKSLKGRVETILEYKTGNCGEMSKVGYYATQDSEIAQIFGDDGDHAFLVIGRDKEFLFSDYKNWGLQAVVCDVWTGAYYPASKIEQYLMDCVCFIQVDNLKRTVVRNFNPAKQSLIEKAATRDVL